MEQRRYYLITPLAYTGAAKAFTYHHEGVLEPGQIVKIPIGRRQVTGVIESSASKPAFATKPIATILPIPAIPSDLHHLANWMSAYYAASPSSVWSTFLPTGIDKQRRGKPAVKPKPGQGLPPDPLTPDQSAALGKIRTAQQSTHLLQGVTGSGKTRLYLELTAQALAAGRSAIILVPEITLTPQIVTQFEAAFGSRVLTTHSKLTEAGRHRIWTEAMAAFSAGEPRIIIGPRSCLFMPLTNLGLIVVDECHETSYKQEQHPRYHAVTAAAWRARDCGARLVLGSATPGLTELYLTQEGRLEHILLSHRVNEIAHAQAKIIDLRNKELFKMSKFITQPLLDAIRSTLSENRQALLYLNRRGSASSQLCGDCGHVTTCPNCALPLTFHADLMRLICHHCNFRRASPAVCPECNNANLRLLGGGTKRIEGEIEHLFPDARIARLDRDSATLTHIHTVLRDLKRGELDIIIGTQMIAKGLDLPAIDTVGVISADTMLHLPDFTASERTYQLLSQVSGRAGRGDRPGQIFIQTYTPEHPAIIAAAAGTFDAFAQTELAERRLLAYPPFVYLLKLTVATPTRETTIQEATKFINRLRATPEIAAIGPAPSFIEIQSNKYHWVITIKSKRRTPLVEIANQLPGDHWTADLDPINLL
jgi:primosomal protein N' (replication factor Y) (superfamily II helicase)